MSSNNSSHVIGVSEPALLDLTIGQLLQRSVDKLPDHTAIVSVKQNIRLTYKELDQASDDFAKGLVGLGLKVGDRIGIWSPNNVEWIITMYAAAKLGLILVNINPAYRVTELEYALNKVGCKALVLANRFKTSDYPQMIYRLAPEFKTQDKQSLQSEKLATLETLILIGDEQKNGFHNFAQVSDSGQQSTLDLAPIKAACEPYMPVNIQFTSGTTGAPKGAALTHRNIVNNGTFVGAGIHLSSNDRVCSPVPLYHCFGMVMATLACASHGSTLVLPDDAFDPLSTLQALEQENCTALYGVPTMFGGVLDHPDFKKFSFPELRTGIVAGALCSTVLMERILGELNMREMTNAYGMTETSPVSFQTDVNDNMQKRTTTVGRVHPHVQVKIVDSDGNTLDRGQRGEICTKGYSVMQGYWGDEQKTAESIVDGWMHTGDEGVIDEDGYCAVVGRIKDTIIRGGENIAPKEIEEYLLTHPGVLDVQAFGIADEKFGEIVCVWIIQKADANLTEQGIKEFCKDNIAHYKVPAIVRFVDEYPLTVTGKVQKYIMREQMTKELNA